MKFDKLTPAELAQLGEKLLVLLSGTELSAVDPNVRSSLIAAIGTKPADLMALDAEAQMFRSQTNAAFAARDAMFRSLEIDCRAIRDGLKSGRAPKEQFELCSFNFPDGSRSVYVARTPSELAVDGFSNGVNRASFRGNNRSAAVVYEIWRREGPNGRWELRMAVRVPKFTDEGVTPGQYCEYKVRARASRTLSPFSNSAIVYGSVKPAP